MIELYFWKISLEAICRIYGLEYLMYEKAYNLQQLEQVTEAEKFYFYAAAMAMMNKNNEVIETVKSDMKLYNVSHFMY